MQFETWMIAPMAAVGIFLGWVALNLKTSRPDGTRIKTHPFRTMLGYIMPGRNESVVYFDSYIKAEELLDYIDSTKDLFPCAITHCTVGAVAIGLAENPKMNRFVVGRRLYQRKGRWLSFSMKRQKMGREAKLSAVKMEMNDQETFKDLCERIDGKINVERSGKKTYVDKEMSLLLRLPRAVMVRAIPFFKWLDYHNLLPGSFIKGDGMYASVFIANLGSLKMGAGYHHLFEWGTCPLFVMVGQIEEKPVVEEGRVVVRKILHIRYSYDERIDDGLNARFGIDSFKRVLENPRQYLGCLEEDGSDARALGIADPKEGVEGAA